MDGWMHGQMDAWIDGCMDEKTPACSLINGQRMKKQVDDIQGGLTIPVLTTSSERRANHNPSCEENVTSVNSATKTEN